MDVQPGQEAVDDNASEEEKEDADASDRQKKKKNNDGEEEPDETVVEALRKYQKERSRYVDVWLPTPGENNTIWK